jgi:hypothetical protein
MNWSEMWNQMFDPNLDTIAMTSRKSGMTMTPYRFVPAILALMMLMPVLSAGAQLVRAQSSDEIESACDVPPRPTLDPRYRIDTLVTDPLPLARVFPNEAGMAPSTDVRYDVYQYDGSIDPKAPSLLLNDTFWIDSAGLSPLSKLNDLPTVTVPELATLVGFLRLWSNCAKTNRSALMDLLTDFGFGWLCSPGDPFLALRSPASDICPGGTLSQTIGALPLGLKDARWLTETRVGLIVTDGPYSGEFRNITYAQGSVWVLVMTDRGWRVDAIVGMVDIYGGWPAIEVPVDV